MLNFCCDKTGVGDANKCYMCGKVCYSIFHVNWYSTGLTSLVESVNYEELLGKLVLRLNSLTNTFVHQRRLVTYASTQVHSSASLKSGWFYSSISMPSWLLFCSWHCCIPTRLWIAWMPIESQLRYYKNKPIAVKTACPVPDASV